MPANGTDKSRRLSPLSKGILVLWNDDKGFGFVRPESGDDDHFVHISAFKKGLKRRPEVGDVVLFRAAESTAKKRIAYGFIEGAEPVAPEPKGPMQLIPKTRSIWVTGLIAAPLVLSSYLLWRAKNPIPFFSYAIFSVLTLLLYGLDKKNAATRRWRVPEIYFHVLELAGGWPGALLAQYDFRHKLRKSVYLIVLRIIIAAHGLGWAVYLFLAFRSGQL